MAEIKALSFVELMAIEAVRKDTETYVSKTPPFTNLGSGTGYGGHVYAQSVWAASQTVDEGMVVHAPLIDRPFIYAISHISEGRNFCTRSVLVRQPTTASSISSSSTFDTKAGEMEPGKICFTCICSFKRDEVGATKHQTSENIEETYSSIIKGRDPSTHPIPPQIDAPWYRELSKNYGLMQNFPGLEMRRVDMDSFNKSKSPSEYRQLNYYRPIGTIPATSPNLHAWAHLYASDRNSCFVISNALGFGDNVSAMASLSHSVVFHEGSKNLMLSDGEWWCQEFWTPRSEDGRGMHESRIWDARGNHVVSTWQDGLVRKGSDQKQNWVWVDGMERLGKFEREMLGMLGKPKL